MSGRIGRLVLILGLSSLAVAAQEAPQKLTASAIYCSGMITTDPIPYEIHLISGEEADSQSTFSEGDYVYINKGAKQGAQIGEEFLVMRPVSEPTKIPWFPEQPALLRAMGTEWKDLGRLRIAAVRPDVSIAQVSSSCDFMQRGDYVLPFAERPAPTFKSEVKFDRFAPVSGRTVAVVVATKDFRQEIGQGDIVYVNLGSKQGVNVGDYFRIFRYPGEEKELAYKTAGRARGSGQPRTKYRPEDLPREILGEGMVLRVTPNACTVIITFSLREIFTGAYAELE